MRPNYTNLYDLTKTKLKINRDNMLIKTLTINLCMSQSDAA